MCANLQQLFCCSPKRLQECLIGFVFLSGSLVRVRHTCESDHVSSFGADFLSSSFTLDGKLLLTELWMLALAMFTMSKPAAEEAIPLG